MMYGSAFWERERGGGNICFPTAVHLVQYKKGNGKKTQTFSETMKYYIQ